MISSSHTINDFSTEILNSDNKQNILVQLSDKFMDKTQVHSGKLLQMKDQYNLVINL